MGGRCVGVAKGGAYEASTIALPASIAERAWHANVAVAVEIRRPPPNAPMSKRLQAAADTSSSRGNMRMHKWCVVTVVCWLCACRSQRYVRHDWEQQYRQTTEDETCLEPKLLRIVY